MYPNLNNFGHIRSRLLRVLCDQGGVLDTEARKNCPKRASHSFGGCNHLWGCLLMKGECPSLLDLCIWKICEMRSVMRIFDGGNLEHKILQRTGCMNYETTTWEVVKPDVYERLVSYQFNRLVSISL
ncbi:hypothetical protein QN277_009048 [Acacia crassicarpa]|uniref:Uncharacterized protein n=1 Tax=Acacia crassicarpa TaxID=499986 RepID=A0AAE1IT46_9FABA|nr:hypothetical protein QN277_009048 [Acacia crassicarpa]